MRNSFYDFMDKYIKSPPEKLEPNTIKKYSTTLTHLRKFKKELFFADIDNTLLRDFSRYMQMELELGGAATKKYLTNKVARHTNAQLWVKYGTEGAILSKMMGHTKQETTKNYYDVNLPEIVPLKKITEFTIPEELQKKLEEIPALKTAFDALTPGRQRACMLHFSAPKQSKTRELRVEKCMQQILNGKGLND